MKKLLLGLIACFFFNSCADSGAVADEQSLNILERMLHMPMSKAQFHVFLPSRDTTLIDTLNIGAQQLNDNTFDILLRAEYKTSITDLNVGYELNSFTTTDSTRVISTYLTYDVDGDSISGYYIGNPETCISKVYTINGTDYTVHKLPVKVNSPTGIPNQWNYYHNNFGLLAIENLRSYRTLLKRQDTSKQVIATKLVRALISDTLFYSESLRNIQ